MGDCHKFYDWKILPCPTDFDFKMNKDGTVLVTPYIASGGPDDPITFDLAQDAIDYVNAQKFAYDLLVKVLKEKS